MGPKMKLWVELFLHIDLHPKLKESSGKYSGNGWTKKTERYLIKCSLIHDILTPLVVTRADQY